MALLQVQEAEPIEVEAVATKVIDRWVVDVIGPDPVTVRVMSLDEVDAAVNQARRTRRGGRTAREVRVHVRWYGKAG
jgi:hypothetical protein